MSSTRTRTPLIRRHRRKYGIIWNNLRDSVVHCGHYSTKTNNCDESTFRLPKFRKEIYEESIRNSSNVGAVFVRTRDSCS